MCKSASATRSKSTHKALLIILDGVGVGELPDAGLYGDEGSNTLANTAHAVGGVRLPHLGALGLGNIATIEGVPGARHPRASYGKMAEVSRGKDSTTGHWELTGVIVDREFPTYPGGFPAAMMRQFLDATGCKGFLGNTTASGTVIIDQLGAAHLRTGYPIVYTSADSVFQIAAHEEIIPLDDLYRICQVTRDTVCTGDHAVGRVIARPFVGAEGHFQRTTNRKDFSLEPPRPTLLELLSAQGIETVGVGKVDDLFARKGLLRMTHTRTNAAGVETIIRESRSLTRGLLIANLGDFDTLYGHRNDPKGFATALETFDAALPNILETLEGDDLLIITADHGNDPVMPSTDHSREYVPLLCVHAAQPEGRPLGVRQTLADVGKTLAEYFGVSGPVAGTSFLPLVA